MTLTSIRTKQKSNIFFLNLVFNVGEYRRAVTPHADKDFFDPNNAESLAVLKYFSRGGEGFPRELLRVLLVNVHRKHWKMPVNSSQKEVKWPFLMQQILHVNDDNLFIIIVHKPSVSECFSLNLFVILREIIEANIKVCRENFEFSVLFFFRNLQEVKLKSPDYKNIPQDDAVADFLSRIQLYEQRYEPIDDKVVEKNFSFIKIFNCGERFLVHKIGGNDQ